MGLFKKFTSPLVKQTWVVSGVLFMMVGNGMVVGIANCMLPALQAPDSHIKVDLEGGSWISSSIGISSLLTFFGSSSFMASYGRKRATVVGLMPAILGPLICYLAADFQMLLFGRFLSGVGLGSVVGSVVIAEYTTPEYRGVFLNTKVWMGIIGITFVHVLGNYFHWGIVMLTVMVPYSLNFFMAFTWPESPSWLVTQKRYDEAEVAFYWLRGRSEKATKELNAMIESQKVLNDVAKRTLPQRITTIMIKFRKRNFLKPSLMACFLTLLLETSGRHIFPAYTMQIIQQIDSNTSHTFYYTIDLDLIVNVGAFISIILVKIIKRRTLLFSSGAAGAVVLLAVSLFIYLQSKLIISSDWNAMTFVLFGTYFVFMNAGCIPVTFTLMGEVYPLEHRSIGSAMTGVLMSIFMFLTLKITPMMLVSIKVYGTFTVYGISIVSCLVGLYFTLPETKDKTMQEIEDHYKDVEKETLRLKSDKETSMKLLS